MHQLVPRDKVHGAGMAAFEIEVRDDGHLAESLQLRHFLRVQDPLHSGRPFVVRESIDQPGASISTWTKLEGERIEAWIFRNPVENQTDGLCVLRLEHWNLHAPALGSLRRMFRAFASPMKRSGNGGPQVAVQFLRLSPARQLGPVYKLPVGPADGTGNQPKDNG